MNKYHRVAFFWRPYTAHWQRIKVRVDGMTSGDRARQHVWSHRYIDAPVLWDRDSDDNGTLDRRYDFAADANMNVTAIFDGTGSANERYTYDAYGTPRMYLGNFNKQNNDRTNHDNHWFFAGYFKLPQDAYHVRHRTYHPTLGTWMQRDPLGYVDGGSLYTGYHVLHGGLDPYGTFTAEPVPGYWNPRGYNPHGYNMLIPIPTFPDGTRMHGPWNRSPHPRREDSDCITCGGKKYSRADAAGKCCIDGELVVPMEDPAIGHGSIGVDGGFQSLFGGLHLGAAIGLNEAGQINLTLNGGPRLGPGLYVGGGLNIGGGMQSGTNPGIDTFGTSVTSTDFGVGPSFGSSSSINESFAQGAGAVRPGLGVGGHISQGIDGNIVLSTPSLFMPGDIFGPPCY